VPPDSRVVTRSNPAASWIATDGAAGDFSTMSFDERKADAEAVAEAAGRVPVAMGAQIASTRDVRPLYKEKARQMMLASGVPGVK